jgi:hypothetical protein
MSQDKEQQDRQDGAPGKEQELFQQEEGESLLSMDEWNSMSPIPAGDKNQGTAETVLLTRNVDGSVDKVKQQEEEVSHLKKHRPVSRRFSGVHRPDLHQDEDNLKERLEGVERPPVERPPVTHKTPAGNKKEKKKEEEESETEGSSEEEESSDEEVVIKKKKEKKEPKDKSQKEKNKKETKKRNRALVAEAKKSHKEWVSKEDKRKEEKAKAKTKKKKESTSESESDEQDKSEESNDSESSRESEDESTGDSDSKTDNDQEEGTDDDNWDTVIDMVVNGNADLDEALALTILGNEPNGKNTTASEIVSTMLKWKTHEQKFTEVRRNNALTTEHAKDFLVKTATGETTPLQTLRAAARYKGNPVKTAAKKALQWIGRHSLKTSSAASIVIDSVNKKDDDCEPFELKVDQATEYFCRTKKKDWKDYLKNTSRGDTKKIRDKTLTGEPGTLMLDQEHEDCETAWAVLMMGVINVMSHTRDTTANWQGTYANWLTVGRVMTVGITEIKGKFQKQKHYEQMDDLFARMSKMEGKNKTAMKLGRMGADEPTESALVGNLVEATHQIYVDDMRRKIREGVTRKSGPRAITLERVKRMLKDAESRLSASLFGEAEDTRTDKKGKKWEERDGNRDKKRREDRESKPKTHQRSLTPEQIKAIGNYAKAEGKEWREVKLEDIEATKIGTKGWAAKTPADEQSTNKPDNTPKEGGAEWRGPKPICRYFNKGTCTKGDQCTFLHETKEKPGVNHQEKETSSEDDDDDDIYESYHLQREDNNLHQDEDNDEEQYEENYEQIFMDTESDDGSEEHNGDPQTPITTDDDSDNHWASPPITPPSNNTSTSPRLGSRQGMCKCGTGKGSHGCRTELNENEKDYCEDCTNGNCECDECNENCTTAPGKQDTARGEGEETSEEEEWEPPTLTQTRKSYSSGSQSEKRDTNHNCKEATEEMNRMKLEEDEEDDFDMTEPEQHQQAGEEHEASNKQRKNETQNRIMTHINDCCWITRKVRETNINTDDFDIPAEQKERRKKEKLAKKKQERHTETWINDKRQITIEHLQNRIMTADWEPAKINNDSSYNSEEADEEDEKRHNAKDLHAQLKRAEESIDNNIREKKRETARGLHDTLRDLEKDEEKQEIARELHDMLKTAEKETTTDHDEDFH